MKPKALSSTNTQTNNHVIDSKTQNTKLSQSSNVGQHLSF